MVVRFSHREWSTGFLILVTLALSKGGHAQDGFEASIVTTGPNDSEYELTMRWRHNSTKLFIASGVTNPGDNSGEVS
jgi:hypothetical protein